MTSALARARGSLRAALPERSQQEVLREMGDRQVRATVAAFVAAWERHDVDAVVALLAEDVEMTMPPYAEWYRGRAAVAAFLAEMPLARAGGGGGGDDAPTASPPWPSAPGTSGWARSSATGCRCSRSGPGASRRSRPSSTRRWCAEPS